jgi:hypothetical protein
VTAVARLARIGFLALAASLVVGAANADDAACIDATEKALALRRQGKLHDARKTLALCAAPTCPDEVKQECAKRIEAVNAAMPTLVLAARDANGNDVRGAAVTMDGVPLAGALDGRPLEIDPGPHTFRFEMTGLVPVEKQLVLRDGEKGRQELIVLAPPAKEAPQPEKPPPPPPSYWTTQRKLAIAAGGVGVVAIGVGAVFAGLAIGDQNMEKSNCSASGCPNRGQAQEDYSTGNKNATASTALFIAGGVFVGAGVALFLTAHDARDARESSGSARQGIYVAPSAAGGGPGFVLGGAL